MLNANILKTHTPEILAPAGSFESLVAAVRCGANAVYVGSREFSARASAQNFNNDELKKAVEFLSVKLNRLIKAILRPCRILFGLISKKMHKLHKKQDF